MSKFWQHFIQNGKKSAGGYIGLQGHSVPLKRRLAAKLGLEQKTGVEVQLIEPRSPAEEAGFLEGDVLLSLAGQTTTNADDLFKMLHELPVDFPVSALLLRGERCLERLVLTRDGSR